MFSLLVILCSLNSLNYAMSNPTYDAFVKCLSDNEAASKIVYSPDNSSYAEVLQAYIRNLRFNTTATPKPAIIVAPTEESHVAKTVLCAKQLGLNLKIRSGGHDYEGISYVSDDAFVILDMFNLRSIDINMSDETAWVESGAMIGELFYRIWEKSNVHAFPAGVCPTVGIGGHLTGGGYGVLLRRYGLSIDHIIDAKIVDVQGRILDRRGMGEDLFWAIRGGGGASFGVILSYKINLVRVPETVTVFRVEHFMEQNASEVVYKWQLVADKTDNDLFMRVLLQPVTSKTKKGEKTVRATFIALFLGDSERLTSLMDSQFPELGLSKTDCQEMSWIKSVLYWANFDNETSPEVLLNRTPDSVNFLKRKSDYVQTPISKTGLEWIFKKLIETEKPGLVFNSYGGRMSEIPASDTAFPHRAGNLYKIQYSVSWSEEGAEAEKMRLAQIRRLYSYMTPFVSKNPRGAFLNYRDLDIGVAENGANGYEVARKGYGEKYFMGNFERLVKIKNSVDPENFFRNEQSIPTLSFRN